MVRMMYHHQRMRILICTPLDILMFLTVKSRNILMRHIHLKFGEDMDINTNETEKIRTEKERNSNVEFILYLFYLIWTE